MRHLLQSLFSATTNSTEGNSPSETSEQKSQDPQQTDPLPSLRTRIENPEEQQQLEKSEKDLKEFLLELNPTYNANYQDTKKVYLEYIREDIMDWKPDEYDTNPGLFAEFLDKLRCYPSLTIMDKRWPPSNNFIGIFSKHLSGTSTIYPYVYRRDISILAYQIYLEEKEESQIATDFKEYSIDKGSATTLLWIAYVMSKWFEHDRSFCEHEKWGRKSYSYDENSTEFLECQKFLEQDWVKELCTPFLCLSDSGSEKKVQESFENKLAAELCFSLFVFDNMAWDSRGLDYYQVDIVKTLDTSNSIHSYYGHVWSARDLLLKHHRSPLFIEKLTQRMIDCARKHRLLQHRQRDSPFKISANSSDSEESSESEIPDTLCREFFYLPKVAISFINLWFDLYLEERDVALLSHRANLLSCMADAFASEQKESTVLRRLAKFFIDSAEENGRRLQSHYGCDPSVVPYAAPPPVAASQFADGGTASASSATTDRLPYPLNSTLSSSLSYRIPTLQNKKEDLATKKDKIARSPLKIPPNLSRQEVLQRYQAHQEKRNQKLANYDKQISNLTQKVQTLQTQFKEAENEDGQTSKEDLATKKDKIARSPLRIPPNLSRQEVLQRYQAHQEKRNQKLANYDKKIAHLNQELQTLATGSTQLKKTESEGEQKSNEMKR